MANFVQSDYELLQQITQRFQARARTILLTTQKLSQRATRLQQTWEGVAATAFAQEMERVLLPAMTRLHQSFTSAAQTTQKIAALMENAEREAAALFRSDGTAMVPKNSEVGGDSGGFPTERYKPLSTDTADSSQTHFISNPIDGQQQQFTPPTPFQPSAEAREEVISNAYIAEIEQLVQRDGDRDALLEVFPDLARLDELSHEQLAQLLADMQERQELLNLLYLMEIMPTDYNYTVPRDATTLPLDELRALVHPVGEPGENLYWLMASEAFLNLTGRLPLEQLRDISNDFYAMSAEQRSSYLLSLIIATRHFPNQDVPIDFPAGAPIVVGEYDPQVAALLETTMTALSQLPPVDPNDITQRFLDNLDMGFQLSGIDEGMTMLQGASSWNQFMAEAIVGANGARYTPNFFQLYSMLEVGNPETILGLFSDLSNTNGLGVLGALDFIGSLSPEGMTQFANTDMAFHTMITEGLANGGGNLTGVSPYDSLNVTDMAVEGHSYLLYGQSMETTGAEMAFIYEATNRPDPTTGLYVSIAPGGYDSYPSAVGLDDYVAFDWYETSGDGAITLMDAQYYPPSNNAEILELAIAHTEAAGYIGDDVMIQWIIPSNSSVPAQEIRDFLAGQYDNIVVVESDVYAVDQ
jgi:WXG100 family type VII secretion target